MKFNQYILIATVLLLFISFSVQNASKNTEKRRASMMDYVNNFFSEDSGNYIIIKIIFIKHIKLPQQ